jgi:hypothetical protein
MTRRDALLGVVLAATVSCSASEEGASSSSEVSFERYERAVFAYRDCMEESGYGIDLERSARTDELYEYIVPAEAQIDGTDDRCYITHLDKIDSDWQRDFYQRNPELDDSRQALLQCAETFELAVPDDATTTELRELIEASGREIVDCFGQ